jgi:hypothetical protein
MTPQIPGYLLSFEWTVRALVTRRRAFTRPYRFQDHDGPS